MALGFTILIRVAIGMGLTYLSKPWTRNWLKIDKTALLKDLPGINKTGRGMKMEQKLPVHSVNKWKQSTQMEMEIYTAAAETETEWCVPA